MLLESTNETVLAQASFEVLNPATGIRLGSAPECTSSELDDVVMASGEAFKSWGQNEQVRIRALLESAAAIEKHTSEIARLLTIEQGKPLRESERELRTAAKWLRYYARLELPVHEYSDEDGTRSMVVSCPLGPVAAITPWNYPLSLAVWKIAPALRSGNTLILKPSPYTPLSSIRLVRVLAEVLPAGVLSIVTGSDPLGAMLVEHEGVRKVSFTGSTSIGKKVAASAGHRLRSTTLELGGNDPAVVLHDADVDEVVEGIFNGAFRNNGQACLAIKRVYVPRQLQKAIVDGLTARANRARIGNGLEPNVELGPINNEPQLRRIELLVEDARNRGATIAAGGERMPGPGYFYRPTIVTDIADDAPLVVEEQFGPALPLLPYSDIDEVITRANDSEYGLTASVWGQDISRATMIGMQLNAGQVSINGHAVGAGKPHLPFGGHKMSGMGVENGPWGLAEFTELRAITYPG